MAEISGSNRTDADVSLPENSGGKRERKERWWKKVLDVKEAKNQVLFSLPMILTNVSFYLIPAISVMFAGHLGELQLAAGNLANSWATVTGLSFMRLGRDRRNAESWDSMISWYAKGQVGLSGALETLCGQGYGAQLYRMLGIYLQASCIISIFFCIIISIFWMFTEPILILLHQDHQISKTAALYIKYLIPGLFAYGFLHNILRFLQTQSVVVPLVVCSGVPLVIHIGITYILVHWTHLAFKGAALAVSVSLWISVLMLAVYVLKAKKFKQTWEGFSWESFHYILISLQLAIPSAAMVCLEYWAFELLVILSGLMPNSKITTSLIGMCVNTEGIAYMITYGLSAAASTRVSNELGAGNPDRAKHAMAVSLKVSILLGVVVILALGFGHDIWAGFFSDSQESYQGWPGVCGWQHLAVGINLASFYFIGMPNAGVLGFKVKLHAKFKPSMPLLEANYVRGTPLSLSGYSGFVKGVEHHNSERKDFLNIDCNIFLLAKWESMQCRLFLFCCHLNWVGVKSQG
ncbi:unnamed protein product [Ilex paraguariensis]|uniref:Protein DETOXIFICATION n=1 Tax=Ilex paraguariensis TaxID=185542 RepID=A0ABC8UPJ5_9AQUA